MATILTSEVRSKSNDFRGYKVKSKYLGKSKNATLIILIKSDVTYERLPKYETDTNLIIVHT